MPLLGEGIWPDKGAGGGGGGGNTAAAVRLLLFLFLAGVLSPVVWSLSALAFVAVGVVGLSLRPLVHFDEDVPIHPCLSRYRVLGSDGCTRAPVCL